VAIVAASRMVLLTLLLLIGVDFIFYRTKNKEQRQKTKDKRTRIKEQRAKTKDKRQKNQEKSTKSKEQKAKSNDGTIMVSECATELFFSDTRITIQLSNMN
jgi:cbb3-type cytochrome oxidase subunit 3